MWARRERGVRSSTVTGARRAGRRSANPAGSPAVVPGVTVAPHRTSGPTPARAEPRTGWRADLLAAAGGVGLVAVASAVGWALIDRGVPVLVGFPPLLASWAPHLGPGSAAAVLVAVTVVVSGPRLAATMRRGPLLALTYAASLAWTFSLALVDGFERGFAARLTTLTEYLQDVPRIAAAGVPTFLERFTSLVPNGQPGFWTTHVAGHPPLATLVFVWLDQLGLPGGVAASSLVVVVGSSAVVAVAVALHALGAGDAARRYLPFGVLVPGAVWVGVSADGMFAAVLAWGVALVALAGARDRDGHHVAGALYGLGGGVVLCASLFLNYGFAVAMLLPLAALVLTRAWRPAIPALLGAIGVTAAFHAHGFWWFEGYQALLVRYAQPGEYGGLRPYSYWVWANLAGLVLVVGVAAVAGLRRVVADPSPRNRTWMVLAALAGAALVAIALADLSGLSKSEVERIWLGFAVWLLPACALLPRDRVRAWLVAQAVLALGVNHLLLTTW